MKKRGEIFLHNKIADSSFQEWSSLSACVSNNWVAVGGICFFSAGPLYGHIYTKDSYYGTNNRNTQVFLANTLFLAVSVSTALLHKPYMGASCRVFMSNESWTLAVMAEIRKTFLRICWHGVFCVGNVTFQVENVSGSRGISLFEWS